MKLEIFFDYACPYCLRGHEHLEALLPQHPALEIDWRPCEAHPRPERYGPHSDLCARGLYLVREAGGDLMEYHRRMYRAALTDRLDIEDPAVVADAAHGLVDRERFLRGLTDGDYLDELAQNNRLAWAVHRFAAVPSLCMGDRTLRSVENVGLTRERIAEFLRQS